MAEIEKYTCSHAKKSGFFSGACWRLNTKTRVTEFVSPSFSFTVFRMIMKQHRQEIDCAKLLELLAYRSGPVLAGTQVQQVTSVAKIVDGKLLMRTQTAHAIPRQKSTKMYLLSRNLLKCPHSTRWGGGNKDTTNILFRKFADLRVVTEGRRDHVAGYRWLTCPTVFDVGLERFEADGYLLLITKWQDLGFISA